MKLVKTLLVSLLCVLVSFAFAQSTSVSVLRTGPGVAFFTGANTASSVPAFGFNIGVAPIVRLSDLFYLKPEIALAKKGGKLEYKLPEIYSGNIKYRIYYIDCPIMVGVSLSRRLSIEAGGYSSFKLGANFNFAGTFAGSHGSFASGALKALDYGILGGIVLKTSILQVGLRYSHGLTTVVNGNDDNSAARLLSQAVNNSVQLTIQKLHLRR